MNIAYVHAMRTKKFSKKKKFGFFSGRKPIFGFFPNFFYFFYLRQTDFSEKKSERGGHDILTNIAYMDANR